MICVHYCKKLYTQPTITHVIAILCSIEVGRNVCHGSDAVDSAEKEIALWFPEGVCAWDSCEEKWIYE